MKSRLLMRLTSLQVDRILQRGALRSLRTPSALLGHEASSLFGAQLVLRSRHLKATTFLLSSFSSHVASQSIMDKNSQVTGVGGEETEAAVKDQLREAYRKETCDAKSSRRLSDYLLPHILNLYGARASPQDFEIYAPEATFEDPLMTARGVKQIKSAFYSLGKVFSESKILEYSIQENETSPGKMEILIDNKQYYKFLGKDIDMISRIKLYTDNGKVVRHEDLWDKKPLRNKETIKSPLLGNLMEATKRASMFATHALMRFGKDPSM